MQGTVSNNRAVPVETLKTVFENIVCVSFHVHFISLLTRIQLILFKAGMYNNTLCLQEVSRFKSELQVLYHIAFEQSQVELMVTLKTPPLTDNTKRSAGQNLWFMNIMDGSSTKL